jgi:hypothetical protein
MRQRDCEAAEKAPEDRLADAESAAIGACYGSFTIQSDSVHASDVSAPCS